MPLEHYVAALAERATPGQARLIGVSNFNIAYLKRAEHLLGQGAIATNQVEIHPYLQAPKLASYARSIGLTLTAYQPLCKGEVASDPLLRRIGEKHGVTASAVALAFLIAEGHVVIPASSSDGNLRGNWEAQRVKLDHDDMAAVRTLDRNYRRINPAKSPAWDD